MIRLRSVFTSWVKVTPEDHSFVCLLIEHLLLMLEDVFKTERGLLTIPQQLECTESFLWCAEEITVSF